MCYCHLWMSCCVFCMDEMEASITAMSFTSLMHRTHWFENPGRTMGETIVIRCIVRLCLCQSAECICHLHYPMTRVSALVWCCCSRCSGCSWTADCWPSCVSHSLQPEGRHESPFKPHCRQSDRELPEGVTAVGN